MKLLFTLLKAKQTTLLHILRCVIKEQNKKFFNNTIIIINW